MSGRMKINERNKLLTTPVLWSGRESLGYSDDEDVYAVLEEDGTEVDEEEYFMMLEHRYEDSIPCPLYYNQS